MTFYPQRATMPYPPVDSSAIHPQAPSHQKAAPTRADLKPSTIHTHYYYC